MKKIIVTSLTSIALMLFFGVAFAQTGDDVNTHRHCSRCGMDRGSFDFSRMLIEYDDGTVAPVCSLHCAAVDMANNIDKTPKSIKVADFNGKQLVDAHHAFWVIGGNRPGVMSKRGKWAFEKKDDAEAFVRKNQGRLGSFEEAMKASYEDMPEDTKMIREKRRMPKTTAPREADAVH